MFQESLSASLREAMRERWRSCSRRVPCPSCTSAVVLVMCTTRVEDSENML